MEVTDGGTRVQADGGSSDVVVATITKNLKEELRVSLVEYRGHRLLNLRVFYRDHRDGDLKPSKNGLAIRVTKLPELRDALVAAVEIAQRRGLL